MCAALKANKYFAEGQAAYETAADMSVQSMHEYKIQLVQVQPGDDSHRKMNNATTHQKETITIHSKLLRPKQVPGVKSVMASQLSPTKMF